ncbi:MAG: crossover junction endodeoxyribonuclease RuvC [Patescibacteria group bacterium]
MTILGIDPGYDRLGYALVQKEVGTKEELLESGCLSSPKNETFPNRLAILGQAIEKIFDKYKIDCLAIENLFITKNQKTAMRVAEVRGMILFLAGKKSILVAEFTPPQIKLAVTGYGLANKDQITAMAKLLIKIPESIKYDDEFDAIVIAMAGLTGINKEKTLLSTL